MESRLKNSVRNGFWGAFSNVVIILLNFVVRTFFIKILGEEYLGINGLFTNILYILNFAELGIGNAIVYNLYKPIADDNKERIKSLVNLYKRIYFCIGVLVLVLGLLVIPFMNYIIKEPPKISENIILIYILYLIETSGAYFLGYKKSILLIYQKNYITSIVTLIFSIIKSIIQIVVLLITKNYILYLLIYILSTILSELFIALYVDKKYPFLLDKKYTKINKNELLDIFNNVKSLFLYKLGNTILNGTDNIILSMLIGIKAVGLYSNYSLIITAVSGVLWNLLSGLTGSIGNLNAYNNKEKQKNIFNETLFVSSILYGFGMIFVVMLINNFISLWIGNDYLISNITVIFLVLVCYLRGIEYATIAYRDSLGLFKDGKIMSLLSSIINIILSFVLGILIGMPGIFIASFISIVTTTFWYMPKIIYNKVFELSIGEYLKKVLIFTFPYIISYILCSYIFKFFEINSFGYLIVKSILVFIVTLIIFLIIENKQKEFNEVKNRVFEFLKLNKK